MRRFIYLLAVLWALPFSTAEAQGCAALDVTSYDSVKACSVGHLRLEPTQGCASLQAAIVARHIKESEPDKWRSMSFEDRQRLGDKGFGGYPVPACEMVAQLIVETSGDVPVWRDCLGYEKAPDKTDFLLKCLISNRSLSAYQHNKRHPRLQITGEEDHPTGCGHMRFQVHGVFAMLYPKDTERDQQNWYMPDAFEDIECERLEPFFAKAREGKNERWEEAKARAAERREAMRQAGVTAVDIRSLLDQDYQRSLDEMSRQMLESANAAAQPSDQITQTSLRRAIISELHDVYPEETNSLGPLQGEVAHTIGGVRLRTNVQQAFVFDYGVRRIDVDTCSVASDGTATCTFDLTLSATGSLPAMAYDKRRAVLETLVNAFDSNPRTKAFTIDLDHDGRQWHVGSAAEDLRRFLVLPAPDKPAENQEFSPEECVMLDSMGSTGWCP